MRDLLQKEIIKDSHATFTLIPVLLILFAIPFTVNLIQKRQELRTEAAFLENTALITRDDANAISTYSPWVMHEPGWDRYVMFFNSMNNIDGDKTYKDRIYQMQNFGDGLDKSGWINKMLVLAPEIDQRDGERGLIADPAVVWTGKWHMYYSGSDGDGTETPGMPNRVFHATSDDRITWTKQGPVTGLPEPERGLHSSGTSYYGNGEPSIIHENGVYKLFYYRDTSTETTVRVAESSDGHNFNDIGRIFPGVLNPEIRKEGNEYVFTYSDFGNIYQSRTTVYQFLPPGTKLFTKDSWYFGQLITPDYLPNEGRVYFAGSIFGTTSPDFAGKDTQIGVRYPAPPVIQGFKVAMPGDEATANSQTVTLDGATQTTNNPYSFSNLTPGTHTVSVGIPSGYTVGYTLCYNDTGCHGNIPTSGNSVSVNSRAGEYADLWWHYSPPTPTPTSTPTSTPTPSSTPTPTPIPTPTATPTSIPTPTPTPTPADTIPPSVNIVSPSDGSLVSRNSNVTISVSAIDIGGSGMAKVEFLVNGSLKYTDTTSPYSYVWRVGAKANVAYTLQVKAYDRSGNTSTHTIKVTSK